ncbi:hypothetical protein [Paraliomyxa miuraensis]|uniref:hypothetical protein n=1 Tax=Paraliomyxa miuraensis TaxID=376150 RepID=UPI002254E4CA|nr:hypothetical protein [Paraliomyxa miuraensis]MCX4245257.1 hypothetical protein [Paraliomyxa miuraensis]
MSTNDTTTQNLLFLLAAAPLGLGCVIVTDDGDDTQAGTTGSQTTGSQTTGETENTGPLTSEGTSEGSSGGSTGADGSTGVVDGSSGADSTGGVDPSACVAFGDHSVKCMIPYADSTTDYCYYNLDYQGYTSEECAAAFLDYVACLSELPCEDLMGAMPCQTELDALLAMGCPTVEF